MADTYRKRLLLLLVSVLAKTLLTLVRSHFMPLMLLSVWHNDNDLLSDTYFTLLTNSLDGLKAGML